MRRDHVVNCWDLERAGLWNTRDCCGSCHDDQDEGYVDWMCGWPLPRKGGEINLDDDWYFDVCCRCSDTAKSLTRDQWAMALRLKRKAAWDEAVAGKGER